MKAVILAGGLGTRMRPLTLTSHKSMLPVAGRPILEHIITALPRRVDHIVMVVNGFRQQIKGYFGTRFDGRRITYVRQYRNDGTYKALELCRRYLNNGGRFMMLYADDLHSRADLERLARPGGLRLLVCRVKDPSRFGVISADARGRIRAIAEKPERPASDVVSAGAMVLDSGIFRYPAHKQANGEHYVTDSLHRMIAAGRTITTVLASGWIPIAYPEDLKRAERTIARRRS